MCACIEHVQWASHRIPCQTYAILVIAHESCALDTFLLMHTRSIGRQHHATPFSPMTVACGTHHIVHTRTISRPWWSKTSALVPLDLGRSARCIPHVLFLELVQSTDWCQRGIRYKTQLDQATVCLVPRCTATSAKQKRRCRSKAYRLGSSMHRIERVHSLTYR